MNPTQLEAVRQLLSLPDDQFFSFDSSSSRVLQNRFAAIVKPKPMASPPGGEKTALPELRQIGVPGLLDWQQRDSFPLLLAELRSNQREWQVHASQNRLLLLSNLDNGVVDVMAPLDAGRRMPVLEPSGSGQPPDEFNARLSSAGIRHYDLLRWFDKNDLHGRLAVTVVEYDLLSNTALTLGKLPSGAASTAGQPRIPAEAQPHPAGVTAGISFQVPQTLAPGVPALLRAQVKLPRSRIKLLDAASRSASGPMLAASVLMVQLDKPMPLLLHLAAPLSQSGEIVETSFSVDLQAALQRQPASAGLWQVYLVVGDMVSEPRPLQVETR